MDLRRQRRPQRLVVGARGGQAARRAHAPGLAARPHDRPRRLGRRGVRPARLDRVDRAVRARPARQGGRLPQRRHHGRPEFGAGAAPSLDKLLSTSPGRCPSRARTSVFDKWRGDNAGADHRPPGQRLGLHRALDHVGVPSLEAGYTSPSGEYHSAYDDTYSSSTSSIPATCTRPPRRRSSAWPPCGWPTPTSSRCATRPTRPRSRATSTTSRGRAAARRRAGRSRGCARPPRSGARRRAAWRPAPRSCWHTTVATWATGAERDQRHARRQERWLRRRPASPGGRVPPPDLRAGDQLRLRHAGAAGHARCGRAGRRGDGHALTRPARRLAAAGRPRRAGAAG